MKKLILSLAFFGFVAFGVVGVQDLMASTAQVEIVNLDKDPKKDGDKKVADTKEVKADAKSSGDCAKSCASSCSDKSASSKSCSDKDKAACCSSSPDKK